MEEPEAIPIEGPIDVYHVRDSSLKLPGLLHQIVGTNISVPDFESKKDNKTFNSAIYRKIAEEVCRSAITAPYVTLGGDLASYSDIFFVVGPANLTAKVALPSRIATGLVHAQIYGICTVKSKKEGLIAYIPYICTNAKILGLGSPFIQMVILTLRARGFKYLYLDSVYLILRETLENRASIAEQTAIADAAPDNNTPEKIAERIARYSTIESSFTEFSRNQRLRLASFYESNGFKPTAPKHPFNLSEFDDVPRIVEDRKAAYVRNGLEVLIRYSLQLNP